MKQKILDMVSDLVLNFLYYDRKGDEEMQPGEIEKAIVRGDITVDEIVGEFKKNIEESVKETNDNG